MKGCEVLHVPGLCVLTHNFFSCQAGTEDPQSGFFNYSERGVRIAEQTIVNTAFCILVLAPIFALSFTTSKVGKLLLLLACVLLVSFVSSVLSDNAQKSSLAVVAG